MANFKQIYAADFENTTTDPTYVYGGGIMEINDEEPKIFNTIEETMEYIAGLPKHSVVYFHNLSYDGCLIVDYLLNNDFRLNAKGQHTFTTTITADGQFYSIKVNFAGYNVEFRDSAKLIQGSLDKIGKDLQCKTAKLVGTIDYEKHRPVGYIMDETERTYLKHDVILLKEILIKLREMGMLPFLTAASFAFHNMKMFLYANARCKTYEQVCLEEQQDPRFKSYINKQFRNIFPELTKQEDENMRYAYRGGYCINWSDGQPCYDKGIVLDFTSLYPSVMVDHMLPYGKPVHTEDETEFRRLVNEKPLYIIHIQTMFTIKDNHLPFLQVKNSRWADNEYIKHTDGECIDLWLTSVDYELYRAHYDVIEEYYVESYHFEGKTTFFNDFVNHFFEQKAQAKDKTTRQRCKIILNSCYGKFGQRQHNDDAVAFLNAKGIISFTKSYKTELLDDLHNEVTQYDPIAASSYIPLAAFITAYARYNTVTNAQKVIKYLQYIDTDSLHLTNITLEQAKKILPIHQTKLGYLKCEGEFDQARWVRQKTYIEHIFIDDGHPVDPFWNIKACGLPKEGKDLLNTPDIMERFTVGLTLKNAKRMKKRCVGGTYITTADFTIKGA